jgi:hypothetical protein
VPSSLASQRLGYGGFILREDPRAGHASSSVRGQIGTVCERNAIDAIVVRELTPAVRRLCELYGSARETLLRESEAVVSRLN